jgi:dTDP-4-amino-4,6-dideoxygalactose transaminase
VEVPFFGLDRQYRRYRDNFLGISDRVLSSGKALQGADVEDLERSLSAMCRRKDAVALGSCTDALAFALMSAGIGVGDEVLVTSFSFFASVSPILRVGATPRFVDIDPDYYLMNPALLDVLVTENTKAIIAVHLYGQTLAMTAMENFAHRHQLVLIEDAAQALGSHDCGRPAGSMGSISCVSFDPTKTVASFSSAGALLSNDERICEKVRALRYHGRNPKTRRYEVLGYNSQLATEMAAVLNFKLSEMDVWMKERDRVAKIYLESLSDVPQVALPKTRPGSGHNWHKFVIKAARRDQLLQYMKERGVTTMVHYPSVLCDEPLIRNLNLPLEAVDVPVARAAAADVLSLPIFPELTEDEVLHVVDSLRTFYDQRG